MIREYIPILLQALVAVGFAVGALVVSVLLGKSGFRTRTKDTAYECGMVAQGEPQPRFSVKFYLVAMLFILFDLEIVFMYPWAVVYREAIGHSQVIFWSMLSFVSILMVGYVYALKKGALDWKN
ncbi:MAG: NADH-quinone oxidoreductase subunit A [Chthoniobacterales bacterium]|nr:NADH-quinone oxidoreductase subunit A [Chthoniobacterales bacterium]